MAINKARTSLGVKIVLIFVAVAMVGYLVPTLFGLFGSNSSTTKTSSTDVSAQIAQQYTARIANNDAILQSDPTSYTALVDQGNAYFDWGNGLAKAAQTNTALQGAATPEWLAAKQFYDRAQAVNATDPNVTVDRAIATFYSGETSPAVALAVSVTKKDPTFAPAWYNLGVFYGSSGNNAGAIQALEKALALDPSGQKINTQFAKQQLAQLKAAGGGASVTATSP